MGGVPCQGSVPRKGERWLRPASPVWDILFKEHLSVELRSRRLGTDRVVVSTGQPSQVPWVLPLCRPFWSPCRPKQEMWRKRLGGLLKVFSHGVSANLLHGFERFQALGPVLVKRGGLEVLHCFPLQRRGGTTASFLRGGFPTSPVKVPASPLHQIWPRA
jgi:hypothetical protein